MELSPLTAQEVMEVLEEIPPGFIKDYDYGLGLAKEYRFIVETVENLSDCTEFIISDARETGIDHISSAFFISWDDFEAARKKLNSITNLARTAARSVKEAQTYNIIASKLGRPQTPVTAGIHPVRNLITETAHPPASGFEVFVTVGERSGMWLSGMVCGWGSLMVTGG